MIPSASQSFCICLLLSLISLNFSTAKRNYNLFLTAIKCTSNTDYVAEHSCTIDKTQKFPKPNVDFLMKREIKEFRIDFLVYVQKSGLPKSTIFKAGDIDACDFVLRNITMPVIQMLKKVLFEPNNSVPHRCPVPLDYHFKMLNIVLDQEFLPSMVPLVDFIIGIICKDKKKVFFSTEISGRINYIKKTNKDRKKN